MVPEVELNCINNWDTGATLITTCLTCILCKCMHEFLGMYSSQMSQKVCRGMFLGKFLKM